MIQPSIEKAASYLRRLCLEIPTRRTGSLGNREATDFFADRMKAFGFETETPVFDCMDWTQDGAGLLAGEGAFDIFPSPYSPGCKAAGLLQVVSTVEELAVSEASGKLLLLRGEIAREPLMHRNFPFYNPEKHQRILSLLESQKPQAVMTASAQNPEMAGAIYPLPMLEDGDFDIPSVYMTEEEGDRLAELAGQSAELEIRARRNPARGCNVISRKGAQQDRRVVICAHIDAKDVTPGALDNAAGITTLLLMAELLADYSGQPGIEIAAINGEDYYSNPGEQLYLRSNADRFDEILLGINLDGVGYNRGNTAYSLYDCPEGLDRSIKQVFSGYSGLEIGEPWYQGDHSLFLMNGRPALALTSSQVGKLMAHTIHTADDRPELVDASKLLELAQALKALLLRLDLS